MFENGEKSLETILALVNRCPQALQAKCFEILLEGYVRVAVARAVGSQEPSVQGIKQAAPPMKAPASVVPDSVAPRFGTTARRLKLDVTSLEGLFDFTQDPFTYHAVAIPGSSTAEKTRNAALAVAARTYFADGSWVADWQEVKAMCVDQNCYERTNFLANLKGGKGLFKQIESGKSLQLSSEGIKQAEDLLISLASSQ